MTDTKLKPMTPPTDSQTDDAGELTMESLAGVVGGAGDVGVSQGGKSGGDAIGFAGADAGAGGFGGAGTGSGSFGDFSSGFGVSVGGSDGAGAGALGAVGGDVSDNTSIGSININS